MSCSKGSQMAIYLGDWSPWYGPKLVVDSMLSINSFTSLLLVLLFYFCSKNSKKFLFWINLLKFNSDNDSFVNLNLDQNDLNRFTNKFALSWFLVKRINRLLVCLNFIIMTFAFYYMENHHHQYYLISITMFVYCSYFYINHWISLLLILYQVINQI